MANEELNPIDPIVPDDGSGGGNIIETPDIGEVEDDETITQPTITPPFPSDVDPEGYFTLESESRIIIPKDGVVYAYECVAVPDKTLIGFYITVNVDQVYGRVVTIDEDGTRRVVVADTLFSGGVHVEEAIVGQTYYIQMWREIPWLAKVRLAGEYQITPTPPEPIDPTEIKNPHKLYNGGDMFVWRFIEVDTNNQEYVDLGLPSGNLWAKYNIGSTAEESAGKYFGWGDLDSKQTYNASDCRWYNPSGGEPTKYNTADGITELEKEDDAAHALMGGDWTIPSLDDIEELRECCTWTHKRKNGVAGYEVKGTNGNTIFLPFTGYKEGTELKMSGTHGYYWSKNVQTTYVYYSYYLGFHSSDHFTNSHDRCLGRPIRAIISVK